MRLGEKHLRVRDGNRSSEPAPVLALCPAVAACLCGGRNAAAAGRKTVGVHELRRGDDFSIKVTNWGATLMSVILPDSKGNLADVVLGYDTVAEYVNGTAYFGGLIGRVANRIAGARFTLDGKTYRLYRNDGNNSLHGGHRGFSKVVWTVKEHVGGGDSPYITLYYHSFDGEQGFPGDLDVFVTYQLSPPHVLSVRMNATARGRATPVNLAHHAYWSLGGHGSGPVLGEALLRRGVAGYDTNYAVDGDAATGTAPAASALRPVARVRDGATGRAMELWADQPGVQLYTGNGVGSVYGRYGALCLETQGFPDAVNHPGFPSQIVRPGQVCRHDMVFKFSS
ncbi:aldose 1-epimerase-like [Panicum miliaceum]|uniref:Aldose 1-epimerase-like n=1 Tax=Panicum miliaceum TaxID=4540 RepID=A0A3L6RPD7_PANMI|nr:aldose 1-epimerase-like [Panicum miliaceum]